MIAKLHIQVSRKEGRTQLITNFSTPPLRIADITENKNAGGLYLMLLSTSPGILDGDDYDLKIEVADDCTLHLHTQSYQRLFNMKKGARQVTNIQVGKRSSLVYLPHPTVPHEHSIFTAMNNIYLSANSSLIWGEVLTCGRNNNDEVFRLTKYHNTTSIFINDKLVIKENQLLQPSRLDPFAIGQLEGYTHQASLIMISKAADNPGKKAIAFQLLSTQPDISFGITIGPANSIIIRMLGYKAEKLFLLLNLLEKALSVNSSSVEKNITYVD